MPNNIIEEGLRPLDLKNTLLSIFEVDSYRSKMGEDKDVCVLSFTVKDKHPAKDVMEFIEKGYNFVLDADVSSGENENGEYSVFVELKRTPSISLEIKEITEGLKRLTGIESWKFKYHKDEQEFDVTEDALKNKIPATPQMYEGLLHQVKTESIKSFFNKTLMDDLVLENNVITFYKPFDQKIQLRLVDNDQVVNEESPQVDENSVAEIFWLTKVLGDYNISKRGNKFAFENQGQTIFLQRIE
jgi:hypothetical protein